MENINEMQVTKRNGQLQEVSFEGNRLFLKFYNSIDNSYSNGILTFNKDMKICKMVVSYV